MEKGIRHEPVGQKTYEFLFPSPSLKNWVKSSKVEEGVFSTGVKQQKKLGGGDQGLK